MKKFAANKYFLQVRYREYRGVQDDMNYSYHDTRAEAVKALIEREQAAIALLEKQVKNARKRLQAFVKKEGK